MKFGSVCSGIEAASVAFNQLGWEAAWFAEIEPFPSAVLAHHYPQVPNLGDMTKIVEKLHTFEISAPDVLCGGTPCQAFSVAGLRNSLDDARGNLSLTFCEIANAIDTTRLLWGEQPAIIFWENVPGVLSTKDNAFGCFLAGLAGEDDALIAPGGKWTDAGYVHGPQRTVAWRTLDAQYFGLAQRRRRVFVVASARDGFDPAKVLFEFDGVRRDTAPSREARQKVAGTIAKCSFSGGAGGRPEGAAGNHFAPSVAQCLTTRTGKRYDPETETILPTTSGGVAFGFNVCPDHCGGDKKGQDVAFVTLTDVARTLDCTGADVTRKQGGTGVAFSIMPMNSGKDYKGRETDIAQPLMAGGPVGGNQGGDFVVQPVALPSMQVRRLTPVECARLQGFPDDYLDITFRKKPAADGPKYKALGNSWAVPVVAWIGRRIQQELTA